LIHCWCPKFS